MQDEKDGKMTWRGPRRAVLSGKLETLGGTLTGACETLAFVYPYPTSCSRFASIVNLGVNPGVGYTGILRGPCPTGPTVFGCAAATPGS